MMSESMILNSINSVFELSLLYIKLKFLLTWYSFGPYKSIPSLVFGLSIISLYPEPFLSFNLFYYF